VRRRNETKERDKSSDQSISLSGTMPWKRRLTIRGWFAQRKKPHVLVVGDGVRKGSKKKGRLREKPA